MLTNTTDDNPKTLSTSKRPRRRMGLALFLILMVALIVGYFVKAHHEKVEFERFKAQYEAECMERIRIQDSIAEAKRIAEELYYKSPEYLRKKQIEDSIYKANLPSYMLEDVEKMVRAKVPKYSNITLWKRDKYKWIVKFERDIGEKHQEYLRFFDPENKKFGKEIKVVSSPHRRNQRNGYTDWYVVGKSNEYYREYREGGLWHYVNDEEKETWFFCLKKFGDGFSPCDKARIRNAPDEYDRDEYEDEEDYLNNEEDDLRFYYGL